MFYTVGYLIFYGLNNENRFLFDCNTFILQIDFIVCNVYINCENWYSELKC